MEKFLRFSEPFLTVEYISFCHEYEVDKKSIIINLDLDPMEIGDRSLLPFQSLITRRQTIEKAQNMLAITIADEQFFGENKKIDREIIQHTWSHIYDLIMEEKMQQIPLWRSEKERRGNVELNLWYAPAGTHCGLHNSHDFQEVHTQIFGLGSMQLFSDNDPATLYREVMMAPGFTHEPFYDHQGKYPWHQYFAYTDCIWLAIETHA